MKNILKIVLLLSFLFSFTKNVLADVTVNSKAHIAIEMETGKILKEKNSEEKLPIASVAKIVTMYLVLEEINSNGKSWDEEVTISPYLIELSKDPELGSIRLDSSHKYTVRDLFHAMCIVSSNSATMALGDWLTDDNDQSSYIDKVHGFLNKLGLKDYTFVSSSGLENSDIGGYMIDGSNLSDYNKLSAKDVSIIARKLIINYPEILEVSSLEKYTLSDGQILNNTFNVLKGKSNYDNSLNADGLKTGFTYIAGFCFVGTEWNGEYRTITVVLNSENYGLETNQLMKFAREHYEKININKLIDNKFLVKVNNGEVNNLELELNRDNYLIVNKDDSSIKLEQHLSKVTAPVIDNEIFEVGTIFDNNDSLGYVGELPKVSGLATKEVSYKPFMFVNSVDFEGVWSEFSFNN